MRLVALTGTLFLSCLFLTLQHLALAGFWYWKYPGFDLVMHATGGVIIGMLCIFFMLTLWKNTSATLQGVTIVIVALTIGLLWEVFEVYIGAFNAVGYTLDTLTDLLAGVLGALSMFFFYLVWRRHA